MAQRSGEISRSGALHVEVSDTVGAGDTFDAGFVYGTLHGWPLDRCLRLGAVCGSLSTRAYGGVEAQPTLDEALNARVYEVIVRQPLVLGARDSGGAPLRRAGDPGLVAAKNDSRRVTGAAAVIDASQRRSMEG